MLGRRYKIKITPDQCKNNRHAVAGMTLLDDGYYDSHRGGTLTPEEQEKRGLELLWGDVGTRGSIRLNGELLSGNVLKTKDDLEAKLRTALGSQYSTFLKHYSQGVGAQVQGRCLPFLLPEKKDDPITIELDGSKPLLTGPSEDDLPPMTRPGENETKVEIVVGRDKDKGVVYYVTEEILSLNILPGCENSKERCRVKTVAELTPQGFRITWHTNQPLISGLLKGDKKTLQPYLKTPPSEPKPSFAWRLKQAWKNNTNTIRKARTGFFLTASCALIVAGICFPPLMIFGIVSLGAAGLSSIHRAERRNVIDEDKPSPAIKSSSLVKKNGSLERPAVVEIRRSSSALVIKKTFDKTGLEKYLQQEEDALKEKTQQEEAQRARRVSRVQESMQQPTPSPSAPLKCFPGGDGADVNDRTQLVRRSMSRGTIG